MTSHKYTLDEIDRMREAIKRYGPWPNDSYKPSERGVEIEARLRTYMSNGTDADELCDGLRTAAEKAWEEEARWRKAEREREAQRIVDSPPKFTSSHRWAWWK